MDDAGLSRRRLLQGVGLAAVATGLAGCRSPSSPSPSPSSPMPSPSIAARPSGPAAPSPQTNEAALRRKIASMLVVGFRGQRVDAGHWIMRAITRLGLGGVILFDRDQLTGARRNITSPDQVTTLIRTLRNASTGRLIVSIDQEGGAVARLNPDDGFPATRSEADVGATNSPTGTRAWAGGMARTLASIGVGLNFAPVVDLNVNRTNPAIGALGRSFSASSDVVVANAAEEVREHRAAAVRTVLKHFPGFGSATGNTDFGVVDVSATWRPTELEPFRRLIAAGATDAVMVAHLLNRQLDPARPASLSHAVVQDLLRGRLGWHGAVVSDDMQAAAISKRYGRDEAVTLALQAGVDMLVFANQQVYDEHVVDDTVAVVVDLVRRGRISEAQIDRSIARIDRLRPGS
ncbi:MAG TPA: glycoside hydrolase family 3 N-terminal domain-containing protein [Micromonosporaceae bacterium]|jgi:beta-N-acetylhexosaminidase